MISTAQIKINKDFQYLFTFIFILIVFVSCDTSEPTLDEIDSPYITLSVGDFRQYYIIQRDLYVNWEIVDKIDTVDNLEIYKITESYYFPIGPITGILYYFIADNFLWEIVPDTSTDGPDIKKATRVAQVYPIENMVFETGGLYPDSSSINIHVAFIDTIKVQAGTFLKVAQHSRNNNTFFDNFKSFYAKEWGLVASQITTPSEVIDIESVYLKVNNQEIGNYKELIVKGDPLERNNDSVNKIYEDVYDNPKMFSSIFSSFYFNHRTTRK